MSSRNTIQKETIYKTLCDLANHPTVEEIYLKLHSSMPQISLATVYRDLSNLESEGKVQKINTLVSQAHYDHNTRKHFHIQCSECSRVFDVEVADMPKLESFITDNNGFDVKGFELIFSGLCPNCKKT